MSRASRSLRRDPRWCTLAPFSSRRHVPGSEVTVSAHDLAARIEGVQAGEEIVVTRHGHPVARVLGADATPMLDQPIARGVVTLPRGPHQVA